ncbi:hypothetical protein C8R48DRAFT_678852 [Suillus tomentosus]|nr:hypothetical protein C8R48DRAFT_678852 [Suillus tomentosus]
MQRDFGSSVCYHCDSRPSGPAGVFAPANHIREMGLWLRLVLYCDSRPSGPVERLLPHITSGKLHFGSSLLYCDSRPSGPVGASAPAYHIREMALWLRLCYIVIQGHLALWERLLPHVTSGKWHFGSSVCYHFDSRPSGPAGAFAPAYHIREMGLWLRLVLYCDSRPSGPVGASAPAYHIREMALWLQLVLYCDSRPSGPVGASAPACHIREMALWFQRCLFDSRPSGPVGALLPHITSGKWHFGPRCYIVIQGHLALWERLLPHITSGKWHFGSSVCYHCDSRPSGPVERLLRVSHRAMVFWHPQYWDAVCSVQ